jgi:hypothetical protein
VAEASFVFAWNIAPAKASKERESLLKKLRRCT